MQRVLRDSPHGDATIDCLMHNCRMRTLPSMPVLLVTVACAISATSLPVSALAQTSIRTARSDSVLAACPSTAKPAQPSEAQRRSARDLAARAQEASIVDDNATARTLYERAEQLDATDPSTAYALARAYETADDPRALTEFCRFLSLAPNGPEAADAQQRVVSLSAELAARKAAARAAVLAATPPAQSAGTAFALGLLIPGMGQYYTHRPGAGFLFTATAAGALFYATQSRTVTTETTQTAIDPNGKPYQYQTVSSHNEHPNAAAGIAAAASIAALGAIEAYVHAKGAGVDEPSSSLTLRDTSAAQQRVSPIVTPVERGLGLGLRVPLTLSH